MTPEDRLKHLLRSSGADPGGHEPWEQFIGRAHRARARHRVVSFGAAAVVIAAGILGGVTLMDITPAQDRPNPAQTHEEERPRDMEELEEELHRTERRVLKDERLVPGPGRRRGLIPVEAPDRRPKGTKKAPVGEGPSEPERPDDDVVRRGNCGGLAATVVGTEGNDRLRGTNGPDVLVAFGGDDVLIGLGGVDYICAGPGNDSLSGGAGEDLLYAAEGDDSINGDGGHDHIWYSEATQAMFVNLAEGTAQGEGTDTLSSIESVVATNFADTLIGNAADNGIFARGGADSISGGAGDDWLHPEGGDDIVNGEDGIDMVAFPFSPAGVRIDLSANTAVGDGVDTLSGIESASGSYYDDVFTGDERNNAFQGTGGNDTASGGAGNDHLSGQQGDDKLDGGAGDDILIGGEGTDICSNGEQEQSCETSGGVAATSLITLALGTVVHRSRRRRRACRSEDPRFGGRN